jgi:hypothetical protein
MAVLAGQDARPLLAKQASLELQIRRRSLVAGADSASRGHGPAGDLRGLADVLGDRILLEIVQHRGRLIALTLDGAAAGRRRQQQMRDLGDAASVLADVSGLRFSLRRLSRRHGTAVSLDAAGGQATAAGARLAAALLGALPGDPRPLVLIPTGALHAVPWHRLPGWESRPVTVAPSAELWLRGERQRRSAGSSAGTGVVLACGPGLPGAEHEVAALSELYGSATVLQGADATVGRVLAAMESSSLAHVAAHGVVRADNPQFSSLRLVDGPLTVYDLEGMPKVPGCLVLSACDAGLSDVKPGDELRGFVAALLALGASSVVASVVPVPDLAARPLMLAFHRGLVDGLSPAEALALAQIDPSVDRDSGVAAGFVCFGSG